MEANNCPVGFGCLSVGLGRVGFASGRFSGKKSLGFGRLSVGSGLRKKVAWVRSPFDWVGFAETSRSGLVAIRVGFEGYIRAKKKSRYICFFFQSCSPDFA